MRIGIDCRTILSPDTGEQAGTAHYTYELVRHLIALQQGAPLHARVPLVFVLFFDSRVKSPLLPPLEKGDRGGFDNVEIIFLPVSRLPLVTTHWFLFRALTRAKLDLFHSPAHPLPLFYRGKMIYTVHDLAIYDHPEWFPGGARKWFSTRVTVPRSIRLAARLIAPSESTKRDIIRLFSVPEEKIKVIYEGAPKQISDFRFSRFHRGSPDGIEDSRLRRDSTASGQIADLPKQPYFLFIGTIEPRKNLVRLIDAFIRFQLQNSSIGKMIRSDQIDYRRFSLVLVGGKGWNNDDVFMQIERANLKLGKGAVHYLGYVSEEKKVELFKNATAFVWPSLYEGFGLPVLEAMAAGTPVITSKTSSMPEVTGDAALLVDPEHIDEITRAMEKLAHDSTLREELKKRGIARAKQFSWEKVAQETLGVYRNAIR